MFPLKISGSSRIYIDSPTSSGSGGPESLHQLGFKLRNSGYEAFMFYGGPGNGPCHPELSSYGVPFADSVEDETHNLLVVPEVRTELVYRYRQIRKCIWWLSVDNFFRIRRKRNILKKMVAYLLRGERAYDFVDHDDLFHLAISDYAWNFLISNDIPASKVRHLCGYINNDFIRDGTGKKSVRKNWVAYNPRKGIQFTKMLMNNLPQASWKPIVNMTRGQVIDLLLQCKLYIDFGNFPGKERLPREAAICGCCVITGMQGAAAYKSDVPIPEEFKFEGSRASIPGIIGRIRDCLERFDTESPRFDAYRSLVLQEEEKFDLGISEIFSRGTT